MTIRVLEHIAKWLKDLNSSVHLPKPCLRFYPKDMPTWHKPSAHVKKRSQVCPHLSAFNGILQGNHWRLRGLPKVPPQSQLATSSRSRLPKTDSKWDMKTAYSTSPRSSCNRS